jgi:hypothetical protein
MKWEYCLLTCTPMSGLDEGGIRIAYQLVAPDHVKRLDILSDDPSPTVGIGRLLNELGGEGWELVAYDTTTNRGVFKRPREASQASGTGTKP